MTIIIRLQGLDVKAGTEDIRTFFKRLNIPEGGVYILGGCLREAFIAFSTEKDAQLAMRLTGHILKGSNVTLHISNMAELEHKLKSLLNKKTPSPNLVKIPRPSRDANLHMNERNLSPQTADLPPSTMLHDITTANLQQLLCADTTNQQDPSAPTLDSSTAFLLGICTVLQGLQSSDQSKDDVINYTEAGNRDVSYEMKTEEQNVESIPGYVRLFGLPSSTTKDDICQFFRGLAVQEAIVNVKLGLNHGCLVKFANVQDASDALLFNQHQLGNISVEVRGATEKMWTGALQECEHALNVGAKVKRKRSPFRETANHKQRLLPSLRIKSGHVGQLPLKAKRPRPDNDLSAISPTKEYIVKVSNLPTTMTKTEIKELFRCASIPHKNVLHLLDKEGNRTDTAFIIFKDTEDYDYAMTLTGCHVGSSAIEVSSVSRLMMKELMAKTHPRNQNHFLRTDKKTKQKSFVPAEEPPSGNLDPAAQTCLFVRNMPADVHESQIKGFFCKYKIAEDDISLLRDSAGTSIGEAVVQFGSAKSAALAQRLHGLNFLGSEVLLTLINVKQMEDILGHTLPDKVEN
ncbi:RNA binding motif protein 12Ba [Notolabrus celidotus]|uniref:RNA binding motif protein 12Ba n=1 Tax=Notolabrus celidotus TaxID=1203425 RepID=UPI00148FC892|nr:RNA binding motif protein 12Ba [Notolabrus celidotus]